ncbi:hypothetical protein HPCU_05810 [Helicobacter pylori Cuz20]|uniref:Uncharacterized protein n=1 Tax=Helicobacter pylori (strain Cuz20) TaxID=765964 RepID=A0AB32X8S4_HELPC|nr:hypothetical protein HPCU_05810 [Helicobacter pylori Cuz20]
MLSFERLGLFFLLFNLLSPLFYWFHLILTFIEFNRLFLVFSFLCLSFYFLLAVLNFLLVVLVV